MSQSGSGGGGCAIMSLGVLLTVAFVVLKLCNVITWSWWWVISPLPIAFVVSLIFTILLVIGFAALFS